LALAAVQLLLLALIWPATALRATAQVLTEVTQLNFGALEIPAAGSVTATLSVTGAFSGTATQLYGTVSGGRYTITRGTLGTGTITLDIQNVSTGNAAVTLTDFTGRWGTTPIASFPQSGLGRPSVGGTTLRIGATLTFDSSVNPSTINPSFDIVMTQP
jgi:hypothetical protein